MRRFEVTLTYKSNDISLISSKRIFVKQQKFLDDVNLDDSQCYSPEEFCKSIISEYERPDVVRINIKEKFDCNEQPVNWITENMGRIYFYNGVPLVLNRN